METHFLSHDHLPGIASSSNEVQHVLGSPKSLVLSADFGYRPLSESEGENFRLLSLHPGRFQDAIHCDIFHANIENEIEYDAVSYTWATDTGDASLSQMITCSYVGELEAKLLRITENCASALRRLRDEESERIIWIDAISIDQSNLEERSRHVKSIADIFFNASQVMVYLGEEDLGFGSRTMWLDESKRRFAVQQLFTKRWASRLWAVQEVSFAQKVMVITGDVTFQLTSDLLFRIRGRAKAYRCIVPGPLAWDARSNVATRDLLSMLHLTRDCLSTDARDRVYGLIGFASETLQELLTIDYSQSLEEVLTSAAGAIIVSREDLDILAYASSALGSRHAKGCLPTWVPDWEEYRDHKALRPQFQSDAIGPWRSLNKLSGLGSHSKNLQGLDWSATVQISPSWTTSPDSKPFIMVQAHCIGAVDDASQQCYGFVPRIQSAPVFSRQMMGLLDGNTAPHLWPLEFQWILHLNRKQSLSRSDLPFNRNDLVSFCMELSRLEENKFLFRAGHLPAITTSIFRDGDTVWAVDGCRIPLILRSLGGDSFQVVGNCQLLSLQFLDCWAKSGGSASLDQIEWQFDPFRPLKEHDTQMIDIY